VRDPLVYLPEESLVPCLAREALVESHDGVVALPAMLRP
jgi:hypothetical protein